MARNDHPVCLVWLALLFLTVILLACGCSGGGTGADLAPDALALPPLPAGDTTLREGAALDNDTAAGNEHVFMENGTDDGTIAKLEAGTTPGADLAYAVYEIPARPDPAVPYMLTVTSFYADDDPLTYGGEEGYYVALGDYTTEGWNVSGPYYKSVVRMPFAGVDAVSPGGNIYAAVIAWDGSTVFIVSVDVGYDAGPGWESRMMSPAQGDVAGMSCDLALDPAGNPQIAYLHTESMMVDDSGSIRVARRVGSEWIIDEVATSYDATVVQLAIGSSGRRALLVLNRDANEFRLLWDGGGGFSNDIALDPTDYDGIEPSVAFCNGADNPAGELDTVVVAYATEGIWPNVAVRYYRYDGTVTAGGDIIPATRRMGAIDLYTDANLQVRIALPIAPAYPDWDLHFGVYSAVIDGWAFGTPPDWTGANLSGDDQEKIVRAVQTGSGEYAAGYLYQELSGLQLGLASGGPFACQEEDTLLFGFLEDDFELQAYSDGTVAFLVQGGSYTLGMYRGRPDSGVPWEFHQLTTEQNGCSLASFAVAGDDITHVAVVNPVRGRLEYLRIDQFGETTSGIVDTGGGEPGLSYGPAPVVATANDTYLFYSDSARMRILYSRCRDGMWQEEGVPLNAPEALPYILLGAGYLENTNLLYVVYLDFYDISFSVLSCAPGQNNWHREVFSPANEVMAAIADNETEVGICYPFDNPISNDCLYFALGDPRDAPGQPETVTTAVYDLDYPYYLDYSPADDHWGLVVNDVDNLRATYFERDATGLWGPPEIVAQIFGVGAFINATGLTHDATDGAARIVLYQGPVGPLPFDVNVYRELPAGGFAMEGTVTSVDAGSVDYDFSAVVKTAGGLPVVVVPTRAAATPWQYEIFMPDGPASWASEAVWASPNMEAMHGPMGFSSGLDPAGMPVVASTEMYSDANLFGIVSVFYYW